MDAIRRYRNSSNDSENSRRRAPTKTALNRFMVSARERCVRIQSTQSDGEVITGTGVIMETGLVFSNWHLVDSKTISTTINDHEATIVHFDLKYDLVAFVGKTRKLRRVKIQVKKPNQTDPIFYVGNPEEWNKTISEGKVVKVKPAKIISDNIPCEGFSGSGLYSQSSGELVGIIDSMEGSKDSGCNFSVAVPGYIVHRFLNETLVCIKHREKQKQQEEVKPAVGLDFD